MNKAKIYASIQDAIKYLDMVDISYSLTTKIKDLNPRKYSEEYFQACHKNDYLEKFNIALRNSDYDIILEDGSFFQFTATSDEDIHYSFFHKIEQTLTHEEFLNKYLTEDNYDSIEQEYEMYLSTDKTRINSCPIRFDVAEKEYKEGLHAFAHLHIGVGTEIRIPFDKIIKPAFFVDFVIKHIYKSKWDKAYLKKRKFIEKVNSLKGESEKLTEESFSDGEKLQLYIT